MGIIISDIEKPNGELIRVQINEFQGKNYLDLRIHYLADEDEVRPTKKGVSVPVELYEELKEAILKAEDQLNAEMEEEEAE